MSAHESGTPQKLVYMANQIGKFFTAQDRDMAPDKIAEHLMKFWEPRMRKAILEYVDAGGGGLDPEARAAVEKLRSPPGAA
jgi:formate dehydrogenase subunit delta